VFAYIRNTSAVRRLVLLGHDSGVFHPSLRDDKWIGEIATLKELFPVQILSKVRHAVNLGNKGQLFHCGIFEEIGIGRLQQFHNGFIESALKLQPCLPHRNDLFVLEGNVKLLPEGREPIAVIMVEDV